MDLTEPPDDIDVPGEVVNKPQRSASVKRSRSPDQTHSVSKRARSTTATSQRSLSPKRDYPRGTSRVTRPTLSRPVQAQDLANFKSDMTSLIQDMIQSSLSSFASQFKANTGSKGDSSQDQAHDISQDQDQDLEQDPSPGQVDHVDPPEGEEIQGASEEYDPDLHQGDPNLSQLVLTEEEQRDFYYFNEASTSSQSKKGKPCYGRFPKRIQILFASSTG